MSQSNDETRYRIGQVCDLLREEFPDISISKLRFLQDKGIVEPARTPGGYRMYSRADVAALREALIMQRDQFMPLRVIRNELRRRMQERDAGAGSTVDATARRVGTMPAAGAVQLRGEQQLVSAEALVRSAGVSHEFLEACRAADIVSGRRDADGLMLFSADEVGLVQLAAALEQLGLDLRHLRQAATAMVRQGAIVEQYAAAMLRTPNLEKRDQALETVETLTARLAEFMRIAFVRDVKQMTARVTGDGAGSARGTDHRMASPLL